MARDAFAARGFCDVCFVTPVFARSAVLGAADVTFDFLDETTFFTLRALRAVEDCGATFGDVAFAFTTDLRLLVLGSVLGMAVGLVLALLAAGAFARAAGLALRSVFAAVLFLGLLFAALRLPATALGLRRAAISHVLHEKPGARRLAEKAERRVATVCSRQCEGAYPLDLREIRKIFSKAVVTRRSWKRFNVTSNAFN